jgi:hypothetical protein
MRSLPAAIAIAAALATHACRGRDETSLSYIPDTNDAPTHPSDARVVLVTVDGMRWQDYFEGSDATRGPVPPLPPEAMMPRTHALARTRGVAFGATMPGCGVARTASGANMSLPGYREMFTGHPSRCIDNECGRVGWTVLDEAARRGVDGVASVSSWATLALAASGGGSGVHVDAGASGAYRNDGDTAREALSVLRNARPALMHIGLGDTDERGHQSDYAGYLDAMLFADEVIGDVVDTLDALGLMSKTTILVTPDHGRNSDFRDHGPLRAESGRTFLVAIGDGVGGRGTPCLPNDITLPDIAATIAALLDLPPDTSDEAGRPIGAIVHRAE